MGFIVVLILVTLSIAGSAAFFSVYGLAQIFTGSFWPVVVMASSLEAGKLVAASYLYRFWSKITWLMKFYLLLAVFVLMVITSAGIFGFLSSAYQQDIMGIKINQQQIELLLEENSQIEELKTERLERKKQIDADIASLPNNFITGRQRLMKSYGEELNQLKEDISYYTQTIRENTKEVAVLRAKNLEQEAHVGPIIFIARVFDQEVDNTTKWLILIIIFAFDPLAVALTVGANVAILDRQKIKQEMEKIPSPSREDDHAPEQGNDDNEWDEPEPGVTDVDQLLEQPTESASVDQIREALDQLQHKELSPEEIAQKGMLEEMLRRRQVTEKIRNHKESS